MPPNFVFEWPEGGMFVFLLGLCALVAIIIHQALKLTFLHRMLPDLHEVSPVLQTLCGTMFVLSVTFLASNVWQTESRARELTGIEARELRSVVTIAVGLPQAQREAVAGAAADYAKAVAAEWPSMARDGGTAEAEGLLVRLFNLSMDESLAPAVREHLYTALQSLSQARQGRLNIASETVGSSRWSVVLSLAALLLVVIGICHVEAPAARAVSLGLVSIAITLSLFVILAYDRPFQGKLGLSPDPILHAAGIIPLNR